MGKEPKTVQELVREIDNLKSNASSFKEKQLGGGFLKWATQFYSLTQVPFSEAGTDVVVPLLQYLFLIEANDLTDSVPIFYIHKDTGKDFKRIKELEAIVRNIWRGGNWNLEFMYASLWSLMAGVGFIEFGYEASGDNSPGNIWGKMIDPTKVYVDPNCTTLDDAWYVMKEQTLYIDEIRMRYPNHANDIFRRANTRVPEVTQFLGLEMPMGPMRSVFGADARLKTQDGMLSLRTVWVKDSTTIEMEAEKKAERLDVPITTILPRPKKILKYPHGRMIVECQGAILYDSPNPYRQFPIVDIHSTPPIQGFWNPPPLKFTASIQGAAQALINQLLDNASRLNKGITYIKENTEISLEEFGGVAGEVHVIPGNSEVPQTTFPPAMPPQMTELPFKFMDYQKEMQGFNEARMGKVQGGNVSSSLQDGATSSSMAITRMRAKLLGKSIQRASEIVLYMMQDTFLEPRYYLDTFGLELEYKDDPKVFKYNPVASNVNLKIHLDPGSIEPMSSASLRMMVPILRNMGLIDVKHALKWLRVPDSDEIAEELMQEAQSAAAAKERSHKK